jgi:triacylglycerol lipase
MLDAEAAAAAYRGDIFSEDPSVEGVNTPLWREAFVGLDWLRLRMSPVYWGWGVPRGQGEPVLVVPGFFASDFSLTELWGWLLRLGYRPYFSHIGRNTNCPNYTADALLQTVRRAHSETGKPVALIGHSLGGMLARSVALDHPRHVRMVISLGSPFRDHVRAHPIMLAAAEQLREGGTGNGNDARVGPTCFTGHCTCQFVKNVLAPGEFSVPRYAVYSKNDGVVDWESCIEEDPELNFEVDATHLGMVVHPGSYRAIGELLRRH